MTLKQQYILTIGAFEIWHLRRPLRILRTAKKRSKWIIESIDPDFLLENQMARPNYHILETLCKYLVLLRSLQFWESWRAREGEEKPAVRRIDSITAVMGALQVEDLKDKVENRVP